jgi:hypothetical protein
VIQRVEEAADVGIEHPVHLPPMDAGGQGIERLMRTAPRSEPVGDAEEVDLVDRVQDLGDGTLHDFVLQRGNAERPLPPVRLRDDRSPDRPRPVCSPLQPSVRAALSEAERIIDETGATSLAPLVLLDRAALAPLEGDTAARERALRAAQGLLAELGTSLRVRQIEAVLAG